MFCVSLVVKSGLLPCSSSNLTSLHLVVSWTWARVDPCVGIIWIKVVSNQVEVVGVYYLLDYQTFCTVLSDCLIWSGRVFHILAIHEGKERNGHFDHYLLFSPQVCSLGWLFRFLLVLDHQRTVGILLLYSRSCNGRILEKMLYPRSLFGSSMVIGLVGAI